ncbi:hypothetical protein [Myxococcus landrumensis]|uniref:Uncharacterized protein n=1 Tax=Myxococcus landrumensis TaxID=2813577 RepID=A0ABX7N604_9BACT|nr:hypothetical protein [Myxococcus landrumus]QSQ14058.1 hypothetical protein JY572_38050 [Myxococcus landrumus]
MTESPHMCGIGGNNFCAECREYSRNRDSIERAARAANLHAAIAEIRRVVGQDGLEDVLERVGLKSTVAATKAEDKVYHERNQVLALLARMALALGWRVGVGHKANFSKADWRTVLLVDLPTGQAAWHFHDSERDLLAGLPDYPYAEFDGHGPGTKYDRVNHALRGGVAQVSPPPIGVGAAIGMGVGQAVATMDAAQRLSGSFGAPPGSTLDKLSQLDLREEQVRGLVSLAEEYGWKGQQDDLSLRGFFRRALKERRDAESVRATQMRVQLAQERCAARGADFKGLHPSGRCTSVAHHPGRHTFAPDLTEKPCS